jgi:hypothetical protein
VVVVKMPFAVANRQPRYRCLMGAILSAVGLSARLAQCGHSGTFPSSKESDNGRLSSTSEGGRLDCDAHGAQRQQTGPSVSP